MNHIGPITPEVKSKTRKREVVARRKNICFLLWKMGATQAEIARVINITQQAVSFHISHPAKTVIYDF